jgi:Uma2 family endonuclease
VKSVLTWSRICQDPSFQDLPFKIEINDRGIVEMSPARPKHGEYQSRISALLGALLPDGRVIVECPIETTSEVRVPDVVWIRKGTEQYNADETALTVAPQICVEVLSWSNTTEELEHKRQLYAEYGCQEFWTCTDEGEIRFVDAKPGEQLPHSILCPGFPVKIEL